MLVIHFCKDRGTLRESLKLALISLSTPIRDGYLNLVSAIAKNPASYKYDVASATGIRYVFSSKLGIRHSMKSKNLSH